MNYAIVLATDKGTKTKTEMARWEFSLLKKPMIEYIVDSLEKIMIDKIICVVNHKSEFIQGILKNRVEYVVQEEILSTEYAVNTASFLKEEGYTLILPGNVPLIDKEILTQMILKHQKENNDFTIGTACLDNPCGYGRIIRDRDGNISKIVEEKNATEEIQKIKEVNAEIYCIKNYVFFTALNQMNNHNSEKKYYLTDIIEIFAKSIKIGSFAINEPYRINGINDMLTLSCVEENLRKKILENHMMNGVRIVNPNSTTISLDVEIDSGTIIYPGCNLFGKTKIGKNNTIGPNTFLENSVLEDNVTCIQSVISDSKICKEATVGPFAHIRMNSIIGERDRIGNFVEIKNSVLGTKTNVAHLTYIGDTTCGDHVNWGCGCVTVNYDGKNKHRTMIGNDVFIGCNSNLIAPIKISNESYIAAGSTITSNLEEGDFSIARAKQITKAGYAKKYGFKK